MPGYLLHMGAGVMCLHAGQAQPINSDFKVKLNSQPVVTQSTIYCIAGCTLPPPSNGPCITAQWITAATRVRANGQPVLLADSQAICAPSGTLLNVIFTQTRVKGI